ncbi:MAG: PEP-CTERM sorting domain-containing protein [Candidatus Didemnitutus sp.]|nr:PEP-CTERM sorting domain-containing protein [Candidatus Didemnitutus sp.]
MSSPRLSIFALCILATLAGRAEAQTVLYRDFTSTTGLSLNSAQVSNGAILLAQNQQDRSGSFFTTSSYNVSGFSAAFEFRISSPGGISDGIAAGADGLAFVIQRAGATALGGSGEALGYGARGGTNGIGNSVAVEFDTFKNSWDPDSNHIGIDTNGNLTSLATAGVSSAFDNGTNWTVWVDYNGTVLEVRASQNGVRPTAALLSQSINIANTIGGSTAFVGVTGATGSAFGKHEVLSFAFSDTYLSGGVSVVPEPSTYVLFALGLGFIGVACWRRRRG